MKSARANRGKPTGMWLAQLGAWNLYQTAEGRYKVSAIDPVNGKANYAFAVREGRIDTHAALDSTKLKMERPELRASIEEYFKTAEVIPSSAAPSPAAVPQSDEADPYGDLAISRNRKLTPDQNWKRGLLQMRRIEFEHAAAKKPSIWESGIRMLWAGIYGTKIPDSEADRALGWVVQRQGGVDLGILLAAEQEFYAGKYAPQSCATLEAQLDMLAGSNEFQNEEEAADGGNGTSGVGSVDNAGAGGPAGVVGEAGSGSTSGPARGQRLDILGFEDGSEVSDGGKLHAQEEPFSAFS